ncbi:MAG: HPr(Ser) kinase/phosphatase [Oscillospiraceae bacterium]|nr:HPr(Ser) kinase/phosphatase [Oscillospiraceae bacterium]
MENNLQVLLSDIIHDNNLEILYSPEALPDVCIKTVDVNRPGLQFAGYYDYFSADRLQFIGKSEMSYLEKYSAEERAGILDLFFSKNIPALIVARDLTPSKDFIGIAEKYEVPLLTTNDTTSNAMARIIAYLNVKLAPRVTRHGVFVEIYGEGVFILGDSGVGKSETAIELVKRGHRLVADDAVEIKKTGARTLVGSSPDNIKHFMELRGIGIVNANRLFGVGAVKDAEKVDMVVSLELWDPAKIYDRMGMDNHYISILGVRVPHITVPVKPGRNLAVILEVAAMNNRQKKMGYNAAQELLDNLGLTMGSEDIVTEWD